MSKLDELKEQFQGIIEGLKAKLKRGKDSDEDEEEDEEVSSEDKTGEVDIGESTETDVEAESEDEDDEEDDDKTDPKAASPDDKQKKKTMMIRAGIGLVLAYLIVDTLFLSEQQEEAVPEVQEIKPKKPRKKKVNQDQAQQAESPSSEATAPTEVAQAPTEQPVQEAPSQETAPTPSEPTVDIPPETPSEVMPSTPDETPSVAVDTSAPPSVPETPSIPETSSMPESSMSGSDVNDLPKIEEPAMTTDSPGEEPSQSTAEIPTTTTPTTEDSPLGQVDDMSKDIDVLVDKVEEKIEDPLQKMKEKVSASKEYISPPAFDRVGRGLVYNCVGKHWACVDKLSYFQCRGNELWNKQNGKNPECVIKNVYASDRDCSTIQSYYVSNNEPTNFCSSQTTIKKEVQEESLKLE